MGKPADADGEEIATGHLCRLVPNWHGYWDYERNRPETRAFRRDGADLGLSMILQEKMSIAEIFVHRPNLEPFAVCVFVIEELRAVNDVWVTPDPGEDFGDAHVLVMGITKGRLHWIRDLATQRIAKYPAAMQPINPH